MPLTELLFALFWRKGVCEWGGVLFAILLIYYFLPAVFPVFGGLSVVSFYGNSGFCFICHVFYNCVTFL